MFSIEAFTSQYEKLPDRELMQMYANAGDYSEAAQQAMQLVITRRGGLEKLDAVLAAENTILLEKQRIAKETSTLGKQGVDQDFIKNITTSSLLSAGEVNEVIEQQYRHVEHERADTAVTRGTVGRSIIAGAIASVSGGILWGIVLRESPTRIYGFQALLLIAFCYFIVRVITRKSKRNTAVLLTTLISLVAAGLIGYLIVLIFGFRVPA